MTENMERMRYEVFRAIFINFPTEYLDAVFVGPITMELLVDEILVEFIKYAFDNSLEPHPLRYYIPYGVDENTDERMRYSRMLAYCQKYRSIEYEEIGHLDKKFEVLKGKNMESMDDKKSGHELTPMQFFELSTIHDMAVMKAFVEKRLSDVKKVSNTVFSNMMEEYDKYVETWRQKAQGTDYDMVFYSLAYFTVEWKYGFELEYLIAKRMTDLKLKNLDKSRYGYLFARNHIWSWLGCEVQLDSRMVKAREEMIEAMIPNEDVEDGEIEFDKTCYAECLTILCQLTSGIRLTNGNTLREQFELDTTLEDWASFFREYDIFKIWNRKELNNKIIRNMRTVMEQIHK